MALFTSHLFLFKDIMSKASKLICGDIIGANHIVVYINNKAYPVKPPTIKKMAGAIFCISNLDFEPKDTKGNVLVRKRL